MVSMDIREGTVLTLFCWIGTIYSLWKELLEYFKDNAYFLKNTNFCKLPPLFMNH